MRTITHEVDFCVVGGGLAGLCAAIAAARHDAKVILMQDRPVLGGNSSSEIRMYVCGANGTYNRETGIIEELFLENYYRNKNLSFSVWDSVLYGAALREKNLKVLLNCTCLSSEVEEDAITSVTGYQMTNETTHIIGAKFFADCTGDGTLAALSGAEYMLGRESKEVFGESMAQDIADDKTMGHSCLFQFREYANPQSFVAPDWAYKYPTDESLPAKRNRMHDLKHRLQNFWWLELGGNQDTLHDGEENRDELLKIAFGLVDHIKNHGDHDAENWNLDWVGFLPGKRESRRCVGAYVLREKDVLKDSQFSDEVAYGGWSVDDHHPEGIYYKGAPNFHMAVEPYGIPLRSLYSKNIRNLLFAGRNISASHIAMSSTRVMGTCAVLGQAVGTAAAQAIADKVSLRALDIDKLKQTLLYDDCYLLNTQRELSELTRNAETNAPELKNGYDRENSDETQNKYIGNLNEPVSYYFERPVHISELRIVFDSNLEREYDNMPFNYFLHEPNFKMPRTLIKGYKIIAHTKKGEEILFETEENYQRMRKHVVDCVADRISILPISTWGDEKARIFAFDVK